MNRIHYDNTHFERLYSRRWRWPVDNTPLLACEVTGLSESPLAPPPAKRIEGSREFSTDPDAVTCRACRRTNLYHEGLRAKRKKTDAVPRNWHNQLTRAQWKRWRTDDYRWAWWQAERERVAAEKAASTPREVTMWRTRAARINECPCAKHEAQRDRRQDAMIEAACSRYQR